MLDTYIYITPHLVLPRLHFPTCFYIHTEYMCIYIYICMCIWIRVYVFDTYMYITPQLVVSRLHFPKCVYIHMEYMYRCIYICMCICIYIYMSVYIWNTCVDVKIYVCVCVYIYMCRIHTCMSRPTWSYRVFIFKECLCTNGIHVYLYMCMCMYICVCICMIDI